MSKRLYPRVDINATAQVQTANGELKCKVVNLSAGGMAIEADKNLNLGRFVRLTLALESGSPRLDLDAIVHRKVTSGGKNRWGLEFYEPPAHLVSRIADHIRECAAAEAPSKTIEAGGIADRAAKSRQQQPTDPEVQRLFDEALENIA